MTPVKSTYQLQAEHVIKEMKKRNFEAFYCPTKEDALEKALSLIKKGSVVATGGSATIKEIGLVEHIMQHSDDYTYIDRSLAKTPQAARECHARTVLADYYLMSTNAFTADGLLVNIDGNGNRVSNLCFGPEHVIVIASMNKMVPTEEEAYARIHQDACPPNAIRLSLNTPCAATGFCHDCTSEDCICASFVTTRFCRYKDRIKVILVGEPLGF